MALGGNNTFVAGNYAASSNGSFSYTGGSGEDSLTFGDNFAGDNGTATFDMSLGGDNTLVFGKTLLQAHPAVRLPTPVAQAVTP